MKRRSFLIAAAMLLVAAGASAQEVAIGLKGGLTIPNITPGGVKTPLSEGYSSRLAWGAGAFAEFKITPTFSLQVGLEYSGQGGQKDKMQALPSAQMMASPEFQQAVAGIKAGVSGQLSNMGYTAEQIAAAAALADGLFPEDYLYADFKSTAKFNYLMIPVQAKFGWNLSQNSPWRFYVSGGLFASYLMKANRITEGTSQLYANKQRTSLGDYAGGVVAGMTDPIVQGVYAGILTAAGDGFNTSQDFKGEQDITDEIYRFNFGVIGAVGFSYQVAPRHNVFIEGGGNYGFKKIQKDDANGQNRIGAGSVMLGYSFSL